MEFNIQLIILIIYFTFSFLSLFTFVLLILKYVKDRKKQYSIHALTRLLIFLTFFLSLAGIYNFLLRLSQYAFISPLLFYGFSAIHLELIPNIGILFSTILIVYFIMENRIEEFKHKEDRLAELHKLNLELEKKALDMESSQELLQKKVKELEKFNDVAKQREVKMVDLIKKIESYEEKSIKKN